MTNTYSDGSDFEEDTLEGYSSLDYFSSNNPDTDADREEVSSSETLYPIRLRHRGSTYSRKLYDVDGFVLLAPTGEFLNVYSRLMKEAFENRQIRCIHNVRDGYRYFIQTQAQLWRFWRERTEGSDLQNVTYHVYYDPE